MYGRQPSIVGGRQTLNLAERGASVLRGWTSPSRASGEQRGWRKAFWSTFPLVGKRKRVGPLEPGLGIYYCIFYILRLRCRLDLVLLAYTWTLGDSSLAPEGCANSSGRRLVDREPGWSPHAGVFWFLAKLQSLEVRCDVPRGVAYLWSGEPGLVGLRRQSFPFCECVLPLLSWLYDLRRLRQGRGQGVRCRPDLAPPTIKSAK
ncbi:hypothetical protein BHE74_00033415 [Ensete ventricosum]|nr:hypothetical protein BHE74_00033415 [Ensete ventricosum]